ncbi:hypothetical protein FGL95_29360 [Nocardiaceae bacterium YC2-7]|uniref:Uncharacterized protein n=1 Tax=Antrihabitans stalactiti TaxID=2584121 RepID=A0A848KMH6_9NOCA|nr:hypothetical protein [Antrihabitans stalactiti]
MPAVCHDDGQFRSRRICGPHELGDSDYQSATYRNHGLVLVVVEVAELAQEALRQHRHPGEEPVVKRLDR